MAGGKKEKIIDCHIHVTDTEGVSRDALAGNMEKIGMSNMNIVCTISMEKPRVNCNPEALLYKNSYPDRFYISGGLDYTKHFNKEKGLDEDLRDQVDRLKDIGFDGIKMIEGKPNVYKDMNLPLNSPVYSMYYQRLEETGFPVIFHAGDPAEFWNPDPDARKPWERVWGMPGPSYEDGTYVALEELYWQVDEIMGRNPGLKIVFAHFLFLGGDLERAGYFLKTYEGFHLDVTPGLEMYYQFSENIEKTREFFIKWQDRIMFGTDLGVGKGFDAESYNRSVSELRRYFETYDEFVCEHWKLWGGTIKGLGLPEEVLDKLFGRNFRKVFGENPKPLNNTKAKEECIKQKKLAEGSNNKEEAEKLDRIISNIKIR